jgi:GNAT superfamily N-acetyltransferase
MCKAEIFNKDDSRRQCAFNAPRLPAFWPDFQGHGIGTALTEFTLNWMKEAGMSVAMVETGGDSGHAPARRTYEKLGFGLLPIARYFKKL